MLSKKILIGTANFGKEYGLKKKKIKVNELKKIVRFSNLQGIKFMDTAQNYDNESRLEKLNLKKWNIITKLNYNDNQDKDYLKKFKKKLKIKKIYGILIHLSKTEEILKKRNKIFYKELIKLKKEKIVKKVGFSIYTIKDLTLVLSNFKVDIIQCPINIFDKRFEKSGLLKKVKEKNIELHARSIFLQGLLLQNTKNIPKQFNNYKNLFKKWDSYLQKQKVNKLEACLYYVSKIKEIDKIIIGVDNFDQFKNIFLASRKIKKLSLPDFKLKNISKYNNLIDPRTWI